MIYWHFTKLNATPLSPDANCWPLSERFATSSTKSYHANANALSMPEEEGEQRESCKEELLSQKVGCSAVEVICCEIREIDTSGGASIKRRMQTYKCASEWQFYPRSPKDCGLNLGRCGYVIACFNRTGRNWPQEVRLQVVVSYSLHEEVLPLVHGAVGSVWMVYHCL